MLRRESDNSADQNSYRYSQCYARNTNPLLIHILGISLRSQSVIVRILREHVDVSTIQRDKRVSYKIPKFHRKYLHAKILISSRGGIPLRVKNNNFSLYSSLCVHLCSICLPSSIDRRTTPTVKLSETRER